MKYTALLQHREELQLAARLANVAYAHQWLTDFAARIEQAGLRGRVALHGANPEVEGSHPVMLALDLSQAVIEEHFLPEEIAELHSVLASVHDVNVVLQAKFRLEEIGTLYLPALRHVLEVANVLPKQSSPVGDSNSSSSNSSLDAAA